MTMSPVQTSAPRTPTGTGIARWPGRLLDALTSPVNPDRYLELLGPMRVVNEARAQVVGIRHQTPDTVTLTLRANRAWRGHQAGQHVRLSVEIDGVRHTRCYSPANAGIVAGRGGRLIEVTARHHEDGVVTPMLKAGLGAGDLVYLARAGQGDFVLPEQRPERVLLISGGSGITPVMSMLRTLAAERHDGEIVFLHYARDRENELYRSELAELEASTPGLKVVVVHTRPTGTSDLRGYFSAEHLEKVAPWFTDAPAWLCGPATLTESVLELYGERGLSDLLTVEHFSLDIDEPSTEGATGTITFSASGISVPNSGATILNQAEAAGLTLEYGCRMGLCHGCLQLKHSGTVRNHVTGETRSDQDQEVWTCVGVPVGDVDIHV